MMRRAVMMVLFAATTFVIGNYFLAHIITLTNFLSSGTKIITNNDKIMDFPNALLMDIMR